jgi:stearoyl-CoA desaturase (delta-9 desaturase)
MEKTTIKEMIKNAFRFPNLWGSIIPIQFLGIWAIFDVLSTMSPSWWWMSFLVGFICIKMLGISAGYHRLFCHKGFKVNKFVKRTLLYFAILGGQGSPIYWIGIHRGYHHRHSDKEKDAHSPCHGFFHSYILWMFKMKTMSIRSVIDLTKDNDIVFAHKHYLKILWSSHLILFLISVDLWLYLLVLPSFITLHIFLIQTSVTHIKWAGYRNHTTNDNSVNVPWLFPILLGEAWHNNHHGDGRNPNYGKRWWELDPTYWLIKLIATKN